MHEMSLASELISLLQQELAKHNASQLMGLRVCYGELSHLMPEAFEQALHVVLAEAGWHDVQIQLACIPLTLACCGCSHHFQVTDATKLSLFCSPCPVCDESFGHTVVQGRELYLDSIEVR